MLTGEGRSVSVVYRSELDGVAGTPDERLKQMLRTMNVDRAILLLSASVIPLDGAMRSVFLIDLNLNTFSIEPPFLMRAIPAISPLRFINRFGES